MSDGGGHASAATRYGTAAPDGLKRGELEEGAFWYKGRPVALPPIRYDTREVFGPFYRLSNDRTQTAAVAGRIVRSGQLWGGPSWGSDVPAAKAYFGELGNRGGVEFYTFVEPDRPRGPEAQWRERNDGSVVVVEGLARVQLLVSKVTQELE